MAIFKTGMYSEKIKHLIKNSGHSQAEVAERIGVPKSTLNNWLNTDTTPISSAAAICKTIGVHPARIFADTDGDMVYLSVQEKEIINSLRKASPAGREHIAGILREMGNAKNQQ